MPATPSNRTLQRGLGTPPAVRSAGSLAHPQSEFPERLAAYDIEGRTQKWLRWHTWPRWAVRVRPRAGGRRAALPGSILHVGRVERIESYRSNSRRAGVLYVDVAGFAEESRIHRTERLRFQKDDLRHVGGCLDHRRDHARRHEASGV